MLIKASIITIGEVKENRLTKLHICMQRKTKGEEERTQTKILDC